MDALNKKTIEDIDVKGKKVLARCDFNVPLKDGEITNDKRIVAALPTIKYLMEHGAKVILCSHLGRPKGEYKPEFSLAPVAKRLSEYLGVEVKLAEDAEVVGPNAKAMAAELKDGEVMLLENVRYRAEETKNGDEFSKELASLCDVFVNDAFGTAHRAHCSNVGVTKYVDTAVVGYLMQKEIDFLGNAVNNPERPFAARRTSILFFTSNSRSATSALRNVKFIQHPLVSVFHITSDSPFFKPVSKNFQKTYMPHVLQEQQANQAAPGLCAGRLSSPSRKHLLPDAASPPCCQVNAESQTRFDARSGKQPPARSPQAEPSQTTVHERADAGP